MTIYKLYTLDGILIEETDQYFLSDNFKNNFTGILEYIGVNNTWWINSELSRLDGPACVYVDGSVVWFIDGIECTKEEHNLLVDIKKLKGLI